MEATVVGKALGSRTRIRILRLLSGGARSSIETFEEYGKTYEDDKRRETIYRELENLVEAGLVAKNYDEADGKIVYNLRHGQILFDCRAGTVEPHDES